MRALLFALLLVVAAMPSPSAHAQAFENVAVPGVGPVDTEVGFATAYFQNACEQTGHFPPGAPISRPFTVFAIVSPQRPATATVNSFIRVFLPSGRVTDFGHGTVYVGPTNPSFCKFSEYTNNQTMEAGRWQWSFFFNGAEVGRLFLNVR